MEKYVERRSFAKRTLCADLKSPMKLEKLKIILSSIECPLTMVKAIARLRAMNVTNSKNRPLWGGNETTSSKFICWTCRILVLADEEEST